MASPEQVRLLESAAGNNCAARVCVCVPEYYKTCTALMVEMTFIARDMNVFFFFKLIKSDGNGLSRSLFSDEAHKASKRKTQVNLEISPKIGPCL